MELLRELNEIILKKMFTQCLEHSEHPKHIHLSCSVIVSSHRAVTRTDQGSQGLRQRGTQKRASKIRTCISNSQGMQNKQSYTNSPQPCFSFSNTVTLPPTDNKMYIQPSQPQASHLLQGIPGKETETFVRLE